MTYETLKEKYPLAYAELIKQNKLLGWTYSVEPYDFISKACNWGRTPQGNAFWSSLNSDKIDLCKEMQPHLFEEASFPTESINSSLVMKILLMQPVTT